MNKNTLLAVDPGRSKTGLALLTEKGEIIKYAVVMMEEFQKELRTFVASENISTIVLGNGTSSKEMQEVLEKNFHDAQIHVVEESHSTEEARQLYWNLFPPKGLKKLIPIGLQVPPINLDGLAAVILGRRFLKSK